MALETRTVFLQSSPELVFDYLADVARHIEWSGAVDLGLHSIEVLTPGPTGMGTRWRSEGRNVTGELNRDESTVTEFDRPRRFGFDTQFQLKGAQVTFSHRYELSPERDGTRLVYTLEKARPRNLIGIALIAYFVTIKRAKSKTVISSGFESLKAAVERATHERISS